MGALAPDQAGVAAADDQGQERKHGRVAAEEGREDVPLDVVDRHEGLPPGVGQRLCKTHADKQRAHEAGTVGHRNGRDLFLAAAGVGQRFPHELGDAQDVLARRDLGDHPAEFRMHGNLRGDLAGQDAGAVGHQGHAGLIARRFNSEHERHCTSSEACTSVTPLVSRKRRISGSKAAVVARKWQMPMAGAPDSAASTSAAT